MALNPNSVGKTTTPIEHEYSWQGVVLYALGCGATRRELDFLYEGRGPKVLPTYAVVPSFPACGALLPMTGGNVLGVVHGGQTITLHKPFEPSGKLITIGRVAGVYDLKRLASAVFVTETRNPAGDLVCVNEWNIIFRMDGGFGGDPPPRTEKLRTPERTPDFHVEEATTPEQALLYRLSGDYNPLHADPELAERVGFPKPILHGLCTYGFVGRALVNQVCNGDPSRLKVLSGQFRKPVFPGETLVTEGWLDDGRYILRTSTKEQPDEYVFANAYAEVRE